MAENPADLCVVAGLVSTQTRYSIRKEDGFMDTGDIAILVGIGFANLTILIALFALMWQTRSASRQDANEQRAEMREFRAEMREQGERLTQRISEAEREQARLEGVNSVLLRHTHTHEAASD